MDQVQYRIADHILRKSEHDRSRIILSRYSLDKHGVLAAKTPCAYSRIIKRYTPTTLLYGIELEIENTSGKHILISRALANIGEHYCCNDGSLRESGIEIVFGPKPTLDYAAIRHTLDRLRALGCTSHEGMRCGIHIHVGYTSEFTFDVAKKLRTFLSKSNKFFKALSRRERGASGRDPYYFCKFLDAGNDRYRALNLGTHTAEFRFFRGTLNATSFLASYECIKSLVNYSIKAEKLNLRGFKAFIRTHKYHYLQKYIDKTIVITPRVPLTDAEKLLRKERARHNRLSRVQSIDYMIRTALNNYTHYNSTPIPMELAVYPSQLPVEFTGSWNRRDLRYWLEVNPNYKATIRTTASSLKLGTTLRLHRSCGWGRSSIRVYTSNY